MGRPAKTIGTRSGNVSSDEKTVREETENKLRGKARVAPTAELTKDQKKIFNKIKGLFEKADVLGELDCYVLTEAAIVIDRLQKIDEDINRDPVLLYDKEVRMTRKEYMQNFFRLCNELSLSPQSRAKLGIIAAGKNTEKNDPIFKIFGGKKSGA